MVVYKVDDFYAAASDSGIIWNDPDLAIDWPVRAGQALLSDKDLALGRFADFISPFRYEGVMSKRILVTGGAGFIGSALVRHMIRRPAHQVLVVDKLTYAGNLDSLAAVANDPRYRFVQADIADAAKMRELVRDAISPTPSCILPPKAMSIARSTAPATSSRPMWSAPSRCCRRRWTTGARCRRRARRLPLPPYLDRRGVRLARRRRACSCETTAYDPRSPYSASKAASDHLVRAWHHTYGLPIDHHQLLEQLRAVSVSREADPADDPQRARGQAAAGLRQGRQRARLALCRGPCPRAAGGVADRGRRARPTASAATASGPISTSSRRSAR